MINSTSGAMDPIALYELMGERTTQPFALRMLDKVKRWNELQIIDVAAGTGGLAVAAAERGARVTAADINPGMIARCTQRLVPFIDARTAVTDFRSLPAAGETYDLSISHFGILAFPTWREGLTELVRVTRPGGHVALTMWTQEDDCSPAHVLWRVFKEQYPDRDLWPTGMFPLWSHESLRDALIKSGCGDVVVETVEIDWVPYSSSNVALECDPMFRGFPGYASLDIHELANIQTSLTVAFLRYADGEGVIHLPTRAFIALATKGA